MNKRTVAYISHNALAADALPDTLTLLRWGENETDRGKLVVNERTRSAIEAQRKDGVFERVLIDFEHSSCKGHPNYQPPPRRHAGAGFVFCDPERGLGVERVTWTPSGIEYAREYPDLSPAVEVDGDGTVIGLASLALVPNGGVKGLSFFNADPADPSDPADSVDLRAALEKLATLQTALDALAEQVKALKSDNEWLRAERDRLVAELEQRAALSGFQALEARVAEVSKGWKTELEAIRAQYAADLERRDKAALLHLAAARGKVVALSPEAIEKLSVKDLAEHIAALPDNAAPTRPTPLVPERADGAQSPAPPPDPAAVRALAARLQREKGLTYLQAWEQAEKQLAAGAAG